MSKISNFSYTQNTIIYSFKNIAFRYELNALKSILPKFLPKKVSIYLTHLQAHINFTDWFICAKLQID